MTALPVFTVTCSEPEFTAMIADLTACRATVMLGEQLELHAHRHTGGWRFQVGPCAAFHILAGETKASGYPSVFSQLRRQFLERDADLAAASRPDIRWIRVPRTAAGGTR